MPSSSIDIVVPTYNRARLLPVCIESVLAARVPDKLTWRLILVDNNSSDNTSEVGEEFSRRYPGQIVYLFEKEQGRSAALNAGIRHSDRDLIGMIDDDEKVATNWLEVIARWFAQSDLDFLGGPYLPNWTTPRPPWLPRTRPGVLGIDETGLPPTAVPFQKDNSTFMRGGNAILRREVFDRIGLYAQNLGRVGNGFASCEDHEMFYRLLESGMRGMFDPDLVIYHLVPAQRVSKQYFRNWSYGREASFAQLDRAKPQAVPYVGRIPRYMFGSVLRAMPKCVIGRGPATRFDAELTFWDLAGFIKGAYFSK